MGIRTLNLRHTKTKQPIHGENLGKLQRIHPRGMHSGKGLDQGNGGRIELALSDLLPKRDNTIHMEYKDRDKLHFDGSCSEFDHSN